MQNYYKVLAVVAVAGAIAIPLTLLERHREAAKAPGASVSPASAPASGNPTADRVHELGALQEELKKKPEHPPILFRMAQLASELGKNEDAIGYLKRVLAVEPKNNDARLELGRLLYANNDLQGAIAQTSKILENDPKQVDALYNLGAIYANLNKADTARDYWNRAVASDPNSDSGKRARQSLLQLGPAVVVTQAANAAAASPHGSGWTHPPIPAALATHR